MLKHIPAKLDLSSDINYVAVQYVSVFSLLRKEHDFVLHLENISNVLLIRICGFCHHNTYSREVLDE